MLIEPRTNADPDVIELAAAAVAELDQRYPEVAGEPPYPNYGSRRRSRFTRDLATAGSRGSALRR